ncbi:MAG: hypothetical protein KGS46_13375 [Chloroflexi bacterium]|jgi:hypothetical protein|nr:hypothetical protein [Chloroflexota bacterium]
MQKFDDNLLASYMNSFWGYGNPNANYWFVGIEEGGGASFEEINQKIQLWNKRERRAIDDIYECHTEHIFFKKDAKLQPTWNKLIRILLSAKGEIPNTEMVRQYQITELARKNSESCLIELLPLPSPSTKDWIYGTHSDNSILATRKKYKKVIGPKRCEQLNSLILKHKPKNLVLYGTMYLDWWQQIANVDLTPHTIDGKIACFGKSAQTSIAICQHPVATGVSSNYFHEIGKILACSWVKTN